MHLQTATGFLRVTQWSAMMVMAMAMAMATVMATANIAITDVAIMATTMMAETTFPILESAK
jgi:hypothetical protein